MTTGRTATTALDRQENTLGRATCIKNLTVRLNVLGRRGWYMEEGEAAIFLAHLAVTLPVSLRLMPKRFVG